MNSFSRSQCTDLQTLDSTVQINVPVKSRPRKKISRDLTLKVFCLPTEIHCRNSSMESMQRYSLKKIKWVPIQSLKSPLQTPPSTASSIKDRKWKMPAPTACVISHFQPFNQWVALSLTKPANLNNYFCVGSVNQSCNSSHETFTILHPPPKNK